MSSAGPPLGSVLAADEVRRLAAQRLLPPQGRDRSLDRLAGLAARLLSAGSSQVSLLTDVQTVAGGVGLAADIDAPGPLQESLCTVTAEIRAPLVVADAVNDDRVAQLPPVSSGAVGAYLGVPLMAPDDVVIGALCVYDAGPRSWSPGDVTVLQQLAESVMAELELSAITAEFEASRQRWDLALEAAGIGSFDWALDSDRVEWDERLQRLFGYAPGEYVPHISEAFRRIHDDDRAAVDAAIADAVATLGDYRAEFRVVLPDGATRWVAARGQAVPEPGGTARLLGTAHDITEVRTARDRAAHLLETMATGFAFIDRSWTLTYVNAIGARVIGRSPEALVGRDLWELFPGLEDTPFGMQYKRAMATGSTVEVEAYYAHLDGWYDVRAVPGPDGLALYFLDITARRTAQERAEGAVARLELLATVSAELAATLDAEAAVARLARLVVPSLADWCLVTLVDDDGMRDIGWWHADEQQRPLVERYAAVRLRSLANHSYVQQALETGLPVLLAEGAHRSIGQMLSNSEARAMLEQLRPDSAAFLPLRARGRTLGVMTVFRGPGRPGLTEADVAIALDVASRAGLSLDNARLYAAQRGLAEGLQTNLLTDPPEPEHCEIEVRYVPAVEEASVGGDWFDSFLQSEGATVLVIGDVVGHDTVAAAAMGQVRGLLRGIAWYSGAGPAEVLRGLDAAMEGLQVDTTATAVVARLEQDAAQHAAGITRLRWSNAGHPAPMVLDPDGSVRLLAGNEADLLLGIDPSTSRAEATVDLPWGSTVLLYTDGLVERRGQGLDDGLALLRDTLAGLAALPLPELCDALLGRMLPAGAEDDVALVAVRLHSDSVPPRASGRRP